jgi:mRNA interferase MazF
VPQHVDVLKQGDIVWVDFGPPFGHEQAGRRPALVMSPQSYNETSSLILVCPITRNVGPWAFKVEIAEAGPIRGAVLVDQVRAIDQHARFLSRVTHVAPGTLNRVRGVFATLLGIPVPN